MPTYNSGPFNIEQGNTATFAVEFLDSSGNLSVPSSANMTVTFVNTSNASQTDTVDLVQVGEFFTGSWASTLSALCTATWRVTAANSTSTQGTGQLRIIQRQGA